MEGHPLTPANITAHCARCFCVAPPVRERVFTRWVFTGADIGYCHVLICPECITEEEERERARKRA